MYALRIYGGPQARLHIARQGLRPGDVEFARWGALEPSAQLARVEPLA